MVHSLYDSYEDPKHINYKVLCRKVQKLCDGAISKKDRHRPAQGGI